MASIPQIRVGDWFCGNRSCSESTGIQSLIITNNLGAQISTITPDALPVTAAQPQSLKHSRMSSQTSTMSLVITSSARINLQMSDIITKRETEFRLDESTKPKSQKI